ncbi:hypothetical protein Fmac_016071 [Flemingia macrophylla]|uniref:Uncharacterized protein n=1 Tax=Flemingia macrophylla TaxID=520843 RepID=A0ABD1MGC4_9FABA
MLSSWRDDENNRDCCKWRGIQCDNDTGDVDILDLRGSDTQYLKGAFNITSLAALPNIQYLDLSYNGFQRTHMPKLMGSFTNLRYLNLSYNYLSGKLPYQLGSLKQLRYLDLSHNYFLNGELPYQLANLSQLRYLGLGGNSFSGALPFQVGNLPMLHTLRLGGNFLFKFKDAQWLSNLYSLTVLDLNGFYIIGTSYYWLQVINKLFQNLRELRLSDCSLSDTDLRSLFNSHSNLSTSLTILDLSDNMLTSSTFQLLLNFSLNLQELYLSHNKIVLSSSLCRSFPSLVTLDLSENNMTSSVFQGRLNLSSKLQNLYLHSCSLSDRSFIVSPTSITNSSSSLVSVDLSFNMLKSSTIFYWLLNSTANFRTLYLSENMLEGPIPDGFGNIMSTLQSIYLSRNNLQGEIPSFFGDMCALQSIDFSNNRLNGTISSFIENSSWCNRHIFQQSNLMSLDLSNNQITGQLPDCWKSMEPLNILDLRNNKLSGKIPLSMGTLVNLEILILPNNSLVGELPSTLKNCKHLVVLDVGENMLTGSIPSWIGSMQQLMILNMEGNRFFGNIPNHLCHLKKIHLLHLSRNHLSRGFPTCLKNFTAMTENTINRSDTETFSFGETISFGSSDIKFIITWMWKGMEQGFEYLDLNLNSIDLSCNNLTGEIPNEVGFLLGLMSLNLSRNNLSGEIPSEIGKLSSLESLDLSRNHFSGAIPSSISEIDNLGKLNLAHNSLSGRIPSGRHFETFEASCFEGNIDLCGEQLNKSCPGDGDQTRTLKHEEAATNGDDSVFYEALYMSLGLGYFTGFWGLLGPILLWRPWRNAYITFLNRITDYIFVWL